VSDFLQRFEIKIRSRNLLPRGQKILAAVSGGADSMVLLHALNSFAGKFRWKISVAHFNHQLRGRSSDADERLVRKTAAALKLPVIVGTADVKQFAKKSKLSLEMAARKLRHEFLARVARERKIPIVALAHHADDQVELFFLRLLRGAGGAGLAGMKWRSLSPVNSKITLIRPLLDFAKAELLGFARENKIRFREDATNFSLEAGRNRIRNELLPLLRKHYQPGLNKTVLRLMEIVGAESDFAGEAAVKFCRRRGDESQIK
jgi:tRNA(Ile)-lysidine synthase